MIPMVDLKKQYQDLKPELDKAIFSALESCQFILGPNVEAFEKQAADYLNVKHAITVGSGTDALELALAAIDLQPGDEVITTPFTFFATAEAICYFGAKPVFVDIEPDSFNLDFTKVEAAITPKTKAILPVHIFGKPAAMSELMVIAEKYNLQIIEDCAQSFGAIVNNQQTGSFGIAGCFSFFPSKNLGCYGDGGMITTNDFEVYERLLQLRNHGSRERYHHDCIGFNSRLDELQAVILLEKLKHIDDYNAKRNQIAHRYHDCLNDLPIQFQKIDSNEVHVFHQFTLLSDCRDKIQHTLSQQDIASAIYYPIPLHQQSVFQSQYDVSLPVCERISRECLSLPIFPEMTEDQQNKVCQAIRTVFDD